MEDTALYELAPILENIRVLGYKDLTRGLKEVIGGEVAENPGSGASPEKDSDSSDFEEKMKTLRKNNKLDDSILEEEKIEADIDKVFNDVNDMLLNRN